MKQLSETFALIKMEKWKMPTFSSKFWKTFNPINWDFENEELIVCDFELNTEYFLSKYYLLNKNGIKDIITDEKNMTFKHKSQIVRILQVINRYAKEYGYFDNELNTISTEEACILYDTFDLIGLIQGDYSANNQEKYQYIKRELKKAKI